MGAPKGNQYAKGHHEGRPRKYSSPEEMQVAIDKYFENCPDFIEMTTKDGETYLKPTPTITGLALYLGFNSRISMFQYEGYSKDFFNIIEKAKARMGRIVESTLIAGNSNPTGAIFWLKNHGWSDRQEVDLTTQGEKLQSISPIQFIKGGSES